MDFSGAPLRWKTNNGALEMKIGPCDQTATAVTSLRLFVAGHSVPIARVRVLGDPPRPILGGSPGRSPDLRHQ